MRKSLSLEDKLDALRKSTPMQSWRSLDEKRVCIICEKTFSGRQVDGSVSGTGRVRLRCPTEGCPGTPELWVRPGNPLISGAAWEDWARVLDGAKPPRAGARHAAKPPRNTTKTATTAGANYQ